MKRSPTAARADAPLKLWIVLARAFDAVDRHSRASIARFGLGTTEFGVLEVLYHKGELPVCEVQRRILVESSSTTYVVDKLYERGLVRRRPSATDRRVTLLALTTAGRRLIERSFPPHAAAMRRAVGVRCRTASRRRRCACCARWGREQPTGSTAMRREHDRGRQQGAGEWTAAPGRGVRE